MQEEISLAYVHFKDKYGKRFMDMQTSFLKEATSLHLLCINDMLFVGSVRFALLYI